MLEDDSTGGEETDEDMQQTQVVKETAKAENNKYTSQTPPDKSDGVCNVTVISVTKKHLNSVTQKTVIIIDKIEYKFPVKILTIII